MREYMRMRKNNETENEKVEYHKKQNTYTKDCTKRKSTMMMKFMSCNKRKRAE